LNAITAEIPHLRIQQTYAAFAREQTDDRVALMKARNALCAANAGFFDEELDRQQCFILWNRHRTKQPHMLLGVRFPATGTAEPLKSIAVFPEPLTFAGAFLAKHASYYSKRLLCVDKFRYT
jgi:hypothetical protein